MENYKISNSYDDDDEYMINLPERTGDIHRPISGALARSEAWTTGFESQGLALSLRHFLDRQLRQSGGLDLLHYYFMGPKQEVIPLSIKTVSPCGGGSIRETSAPDSKYRQTSELQINMSLVLSI
jgi:hypothetical protein